MKRTHVNDKFFFQRMASRKTDDYPNKIIAAATRRLSYLIRLSRHIKQ